MTKGTLVLKGIVCGQPLVGSHHRVQSHQIQVEYQRSWYTLKGEWDEGQMSSTATTLVFLKCGVWLTIDGISPLAPVTSDTGWMLLVLVHFKRRTRWGLSKLNNHHSCPPQVCVQWTVGGSLAPVVSDTRWSTLVHIERRMRWGLSKPNNHQSCPPQVWHAVDCWWELGSSHIRYKLNVDGQPWCTFRGEWDGGWASLTTANLILLTCGMQSTVNRICPASSSCIRYMLNKEDWCESKWSIGLVLQPKHNTKKTKRE